MHPRYLAALCGAVLTSIAGLGAWAYLSAVGVGNGTASIATLGSPATVQAQTLVPGTAHVTWSAVASPSGVNANVTYTVARSADGGGSFGATNNTCGGSLAQSTVACDDVPSANGDYVYRVTAVFRTWTSAAVSNSVHIVADSTAPSKTGMVMNDVDADGLVDQVVVTFSETLATYTAGNTPWTLANVPSGGSLNSVSVSGTTATLTLNEGAGSANTAVGSFTVALAANPNGIRDASGNQSSFAAAAPADGSVPRRCAGGCGAAMNMRDGNGNGKIDQVVVTFSETLAAYSAGTAPWTLANVPSGGSLASVSVSGATATLTITEGPAAADTSVGSFTVTLAANAAGIRDAAGNQTSFAAAAPADLASPVRLSLAMRDVDLNGKIDRLVAGYSENVTCTCSGSAGWALTNVPSAGTLAGVAASTNQVTITITEGVGAVATGVDTFTVGYTTGSGNVRDASLNQAVTVSPVPPSDEARPLVRSLAITNGAATPGKPQENDVITIVYSEIMKETLMCSSWTTGDNVAHSILSNNDVIATIDDNGPTNSGNDVLNVSVVSSVCPTFRFGSIDLGSQAFVTADMTFKGTGSSTTDLVWTPSTQTLQITLGTASGGGTVGTVASVTATFSPDAALQDSPGNLIFGTKSSTAVQF